MGNYKITDVNFLIETLTGYGIIDNASSSRNIGEGEVEDSYHYNLASEKKKVILHRGCVQEHEGEPTRES